MNWKQSSDAGGEKGIQRFCEINETGGDCAYRSKSPEEDPHMVARLSDILGSLLGRQS